MSIPVILQQLRDDARQCTDLIANCHKSGPLGAGVLTSQDVAQISIAAFLNLFIGWESFLEASFAEFLVGSPTLSGTQPVKFASPKSTTDAMLMIIGSQRFFDFANIDAVRKISQIYFKDGYPFEPHLSSIHTDISDIRMMRNASAHVSSTTQKALEAVAQRILRKPVTGIDLYTILISTDPRSPAKDSVFSHSRDVLLVTAELIATG